nr:aminoacyl-tRNA synthetase, class 1a, anticodon-binding [Tanacetum cinerariifolium]
MENFSRLRFELSKVRLTYGTLVKDLHLHGSIQAAASCYSPDPLLKNAFFDIFNRKYNNPLLVDINGYQNLDDILPCSLPFSSISPVVQIAAKLYVTTDKVRDVETSAHIDDDDDVHFDVHDDDYVMDDATVAFYTEICEKNLDVFDLFDNVSNSEIEAAAREKPDIDINNEAFEVCNDSVFLNFSNKPNGGSDHIYISGKHGSLTMFYLALKNAVDADLKVEFLAPSMETKVYGSVVAYFGKNFEYSHSDDLYYLTLFKKKRSASVGPGSLRLMRSALAVPANSSLIIKANLFDNTSKNEILSGTCEITVGLDGKPTIGSIVSKDYSLSVLVNWKLPSEELKIPSSPICPPALASNSIVSRLAKRRKFGGHSTSSMTDPDERNRWSLQEELENVFNASLERLFKPQEAVSCSISTCTKEDGGDYLCSGVMHIWTELRKARLYRGPKRAGLAVKSIMDSEHTDMIESCVVCGPGFVKFKLSSKWITEGIHTMLTAGIDTWAPKLSVKKTVIYFLSQTSGEVMHMGHLRSTFIGETLARMLEYSGVVVIRKRINDEDPRNINLPDFNHLDIKDWAERQQMAWSRICKIIRQRYQTVYQRLGVKVKEENKRSYFIEGDKAVPEGPDSPLVYLTALRHALEVEKADWIVSIEKCISDARLAELIGKDLSECPLSHVGFGLAQGDDFKHPEVVNFINVLDEAKSRCKRLLAIQGMADEEIEHAAEALGIGALKYADLKNNRLANYTFSYDQIFNEKGDTAVYLQFTHVRICSVIKGFSKDIKKLKAEELILKNDDERELGLHLLRFTEFDSLEASVPQVVGSSEETSYSLLCRATDVVMRKCFDLLGITSICKT